MTPAIAPMMAEEVAVTKAQGAVMATRPAKQTLRIMDRSGFLRRAQAVIQAVIVAAAAAMLVVTSTWAMAEPSPTAMVEPGLKPNQPSQRMSTPSAAEVMLWPGMGHTRPSLYLPRRGPRTITPARAAQPPTEWTTVEPAKSRKFARESQPPPQIQ